MGCHGTCEAMQESPQILLVTQVEVNCEAAGDARMTKMHEAHVAVGRFKICSAATPPFHLAAVTARNRNAKEHHS